ncbi:hypothetical protein ETAA8_49300 [Anatilimnocola aggregata]|uniref:DNA ligase D 3'-phosphoesterase domain-containing protein n=1 Tax=Anatilimnocola aggregata TaxID=2528021 RepID=A0A517YHX8_9BACT|nr:DNA polymerase ligase N-terminal domain-containing protein [Anatilimnocola aggregata]QDU29815.1 hypothetical protein ETAA8_49300 [Anatilimnocola aggregata]
MPQFVLLRHTLPADSPRASHYDLMLESGESLLTWAIEALPTAGSIVAEELPPHRLVYLDYEGAVSNNRGSVARVDRGELVWLQQTSDEYCARLQGEQLRGEFRLRRTSAQFWELSFPGES